LWNKVGTSTQITVVVEKVKWESKGKDTLKRNIRGG
jgi:hypothetical protein